MKRWANPPGFVGPSTAAIRFKVNAATPRAMPIPPPRAAFRNAAIGVLYRNFLLEVPAGLRGSIPVQHLRFTKSHPTTKIRVSPAAGSEAEGKESLPMVQATGEIIRMMNYVDDIAATLRRISANITSMTPEERKRLAEYMRNSEPNFIKVLENL